MPGSPAQRNTATRDRHRTYLRRGKPPCALCGEDIDYSLRSPDPMSFEVDHIIPLAAGGLDERDNVQPAHRQCNRLKADRTAEQMAQQTGPRMYVTSRTW
ncbi:HNH endonuclease signature motif containing protein [Nocardia asiatica]|uniref:HNH endonuclease signature motif containing protein n=1 Tax=Nocardia asiatica TaxID=209252 RepID=UPI002458B61A|nr:HNH endonuclease signature motif containing protein [Nocardia asiatica]